jgi:hypothetical protein
MSSRYDVIGPDTLEEMRRAGYIAKLEARIEQLEAALREIEDCAMSGSFFEEMARKALERKE